MYFCNKITIMPRILVIRFSSIGDIVLCSPVIRCLKAQLKPLEIHVLTKETNKALFIANPYVDKVFSIGKQQSLGKLMPELRKARYDYVIDLHNNLRSWRVRIMLGAKSAGFPKLNLLKFLLVRFKWNRMPDIHIVDRYFKAVQRFGVYNDGKGLDFFIPEDETFSIRELPDDFQQSYYAVVIGGQHFTKIFPAEKLINVIEKLSLPVVLLGGKEDAERGAFIMAHSNHQLINMAGKLSLAASALVIKSAVAVLTNDTGLMHIAAAFRKPIVSLWGNTVPEFGMYPYMPSEDKKSVIVQHESLDCRPCSKIGFDACPKGHFKCMNELDDAFIAEKMERLAALYRDLAATTKTASHAEASQNTNE